MLKQYEYKIVDIPTEEISLELKEYGLGGWELVTIQQQQVAANIYEWVKQEGVSYHIYFHCVFKKEFPNANAMFTAKDIDDAERKAFEACKRFILADAKPQDYPTFDEDYKQVDV